MVNLLLKKAFKKWWERWFRKNELSLRFHRTQLRFQPQMTDRSL